MTKDIITMRSVVDIEHALKLIKDLISNNFNNISKMKVTQYCANCNAIPEYTAIDFKKNKMKFTKYNCNFDKTIVKHKLKIPSVKSDSYWIEYHKYQLSNTSGYSGTLILHIGVLEYPLIAPYDLSDFNFRGKKILSESPYDIKIVVKQQKNKIEVIFYNYFFKGIVGKATKLIIKLKD